jgi:3-isopropylmalate/(R)-2-methylmalate dehydratase small subunit
MFVNFISRGSDMSKVTHIDGRAVPVVGDDIDTDRIIPARYLKEITFTHMGDYPFYDERFNADGSKKQHSFNEPKFQGASILLGNVNFGCGSSREHAPQALVRWGIKAIVAESFAEIFAGNCVMLGTPALVAGKDDLLKLQKLAQDSPNTEFKLDLTTMSLSGGGMNVKLNMPDSRRKALLEGTWDSTGLLLDNAAKVKTLASHLPYMNNFA